MAWTATHVDKDTFMLYAAVVFCQSSLLIPVVTITKNHNNFWSSNDQRKTKICCQICETLMASCRVQQNNALGLVMQLYLRIFDVDNSDVAIV